MYGRGPLGARRFCKECTERSDRPISYENALLIMSFGTIINLTSREKKWCIGGIKGKKSFTKSFGRGGGTAAEGSWNVSGKLPPLPTHWIEP